MRGKGHIKRRSVAYDLVVRIVILMALGAGAFASPPSWRILFLMLFGIYIMLWVRLSSQAQSVEIVRRYRHRYANHLQVVLGWLQLQQSERAEQYVTEHALSSLHPGIFRGVPLRWTYQMIALDAYAESLGHMIFWVNPEQISGSYTMLWKMRSVLRTLIPQASGNITVRFESRRFVVEVGDEGMDRFPQKHIKGVRWVHRNGKFTALWGSVKGE